MGLLSGDGPDDDISWFLQPLIWEAYFGRKIIQMQPPTRIRQDLTSIVDQMHAVTPLWPDVLTNWTDNLLLQQPILDQFLRSFSQEHPNSSQALSNYAQRLLNTVRQNIHPHFVPFLEDSVVQLPEGIASWHTQQAPNFASVGPHILPPFWPANLFSTTGQPPL